MRYRNNGGEYRRPNGSTVARGAIFAPGAVEEEAMIRRGQIGIRFTAVDATPPLAAATPLPEDNPEDTGLPTGDVQSDEADEVDEEGAPEELPEDPAEGDGDPATDAAPAEEVASPADAAPALTRKRNRRARTRR